MTETDEFIKKIEKGIPEEKRLVVRHLKIVALKHKNWSDEKILEKIGDDYKTGLEMLHKAGEL